MSTATADPEVREMLVQQPEASVLFISKRSELRLVKEGRYPVVIPTTGQRIGMTSGVVISFAPNGEFRCPQSGKVKVMDPGGAGEATLDANDTVNERGEKVQGLLNWLQDHLRCGDPNEGFYRVDPKAPPIGQRENEAIVNAATEGDIETLEAIIAQERAGWNREPVIAIAQGAVDRINALLERLQAEAESKAKGK